MVVCARRRYPRPCRPLSKHTAGYLESRYGWYIEVFQRGIDSMPIKTIVVALALEDDNRQVAERAIQLANQHQAQLIGVHVIDSLPEQDIPLPSAIDANALTNTVREQSGEQLRTLLAAADKPAIIQVETGKPHELIQHIAQKCDADLLIIGPGAAVGMREKLFGSTADRLVRSAPCPVLVVRNEVSDPYARIAVGVDFTAYAYAAARWAERLAPDATRQLIHAFKVPHSFEQAMLKSGTSSVDMELYRQARVKAAQKQIRSAFVEQEELPKSTQLHVVYGDAGLTLIKISQQKPTDLVALGTQGANAVAQHVLGSVARKVLAGASTDVLAVPASAISRSSV